MQEVIARGAGCDIHQATIVVTVRVPDEQGGRHVETRTVGTMTVDLLVLREWRQAYGVTHVAMESTGVYWKPLYYVWEEVCTVLLVNMRHLQQVPGRKSDVQDSAWLAQLLECGLLRSSLVPPPAIRDLRDLTRYRKKQIEDRTQEINRLYKVLEEAGIKLASVMSDVRGRSGRAMLAALLEGTTDPTVLAELARGRLRTKIPALRQALQSPFRAHHAFLVGQILTKIDFLEEAIGQLGEEIDRQLVPFAATVERLATIPGWGRRTATTVFVETGGDMSRFASAAQLCSWAGMCPGLNESAGKRRTGQTRDGNRFLRGALIESALAATRAKGTALQARYRRMKQHRGHKKAIVAVGHQTLEIAYYLMRDGTTYQELGADYFARRDRDRTLRRSVRQLEALGYRVTLDTAA